MRGDEQLPGSGAPPRTASGPRRASARERAAPVLPAEVRAGLPRRDAGALAAFYDAYFRRIWGYVKRMVRDEHLTEDLTQDILMNIHRAFESYDPSRALSPWVFTIATNKLRDFWQSRRFQESRRQVSLDDEEAPLREPPSREPAPNGSLEGRELGERVAEAIEQLPESLRVPFWMRWHEELEFAQVADLLGISEVAARKRYSRALAALRGLLADELDELEGAGGAR